MQVANPWTGERAQVMKAWFEHSGRKRANVKLDVIDLDINAQDRQITLMTSGQGPDLFGLYPFLMPVYGPKGAFLDIGPILQAQKFDVNKVYDDSRAHWAGKRHGLVFMQTLNTWIYNRTAFAEAGVREPVDTWNWNDLISTARSLNKPDKPQWGVGIDHRAGRLDITIT